jgi:ketosteroid isomerase-like protein
VAVLGRDDALTAIRGAYAARASGDKEALGRYFAEGARFEIAGDQGLQSVTLTSAHPMEAISSLIDQFTFSDVELVDAVVDGRKIAARWKLTVTVAGREPVSTQLFDLIELDDDGKITSLVQFADTALVRELAR